MKLSQYLKTQFNKRNNLKMLTTKLMYDNILIFLNKNDFFLTYRKIITNKKNQLKKLNTLKKEKPTY